MGNLTYLGAALAAVWLGIFLYLWTLRRSVQRLTEEVHALTPE